MRGSSPRRRRRLEPSPALAPTWRSSDRVEEEEARRRCGRERGFAHVPSASPPADGHAVLGVASIWNHSYDEPRVGGEGPCSPSDSKRPVTVTLAACPAVGRTRSVPSTFHRSTRRRRAPCSHQERWSRATPRSVPRAASIGIRSSSAARLGMRSESWKRGLRARGRPAAAAVEVAVVADERPERRDSLRYTPRRRGPPRVRSAGPRWLRAPVHPCRVIVPLSTKWRAPVRGS